LEGTYTKDFQELVDTDETFLPILALETTKRLQVWIVGTFDNMEDDDHITVGDCL